MVQIRPARRDDAAAVIAIAAAGGSPDADERHLDAVASLGTLLVAVAADEPSRLVLGVGGAVPVGDAVMVTDLFVHPDHRAHGVGRRLLAALTDGQPRRMTCSSTHPAALAAYAGQGMTPRWRLLTMRGRALGGGAPPASRPWRHDRTDLVEHFRRSGAVVDADRVVLSTDGAGGRLHVVLRLVSDDPAAGGEALLRALPAGDAVELSVPERDPLAAWLTGHGFEVVDHDVFCSTDGVDLAPGVRCVHRGLL